MDEIKIKLAGLTIDRDGLEEIKELIQQQRVSLDNYKDIILDNKEEHMKVSPEAQMHLILDRATELIAEMDQKNKQSLDLFSELSPETIAASYARISRDGRPIPQLRESARKDVESARKSYSVINFGLGHKSIAEHVQLNFDIMNISRRAVEEIEAKRLQGYTEKSQRYITLEGDFVMPKEIKNTPFEKKFLELIELQNSFYNDNLEEITAWHAEQDYTENFKSLGCFGKKDKEKGTIEGYGKEDARYSLALATQAQLGMTTSGRNLEVLISKLKSSQVEEFKEIGDKLLAEVKGIAPSLIKYTEPTDYFQKTRPELIDYVSNLLRREHKFDKGPDFFSVENVMLFPGLKRDDSIIAGLIFSSSYRSYFDSLVFTMSSMTDKEKVELLNQADKYQEKHDPKLREYELGERVAEMTMSSSAFAQMKRHRMNTLIPQAYNPWLGVTVPPSISENKNVELMNKFDTITHKTKKLYLELVDQGVPQEVAEYALTNAHRRQVLFDANNRQVHAFGAERLNLPAQWDIRKIAKTYTDLIKIESPLTTRHVCGKDKFYETKDKF